MKEDNLSRLRGKNYQGSDDEWRRILSSVLLRRGLEGRETTALQGLDVFAAVTEEEMIITIRKDIGGITVSHDASSPCFWVLLKIFTALQQRLGTISLRVDESQEIELFEWAGLAAQTAAAAEDGKSSLGARLQAQDEAIAQLNRQLEDLIQAKEEHEQALLKKFQELLNSKKLKIRDQQRLLSRVKIDPEQGTTTMASSSFPWEMRTDIGVATDVQETRDVRRPGKPVASRAGKRKAPVDEPSSPPGLTSEPMDVDDTDEGDGPADGSGSPSRTPEESDQETTAEESDTAGTPPPAPSSMKGRLFEPTNQTEHGRPSRSSPPPRRELPFASKAVERAPLPTEDPKPIGDAAGEVSDGETDDDEL